MHFAFIFLWDNELYDVNCFLSCAWVQLVAFSNESSFACEMSAQKDCEFLVKRARELVSDDPCAAKAWLITARTLYPADFNIQVTLSMCLSCWSSNPRMHFYWCISQAPSLFEVCVELIVVLWLTYLHSMKCTSLNAMQRGQLLQGDCCTTCELQCTLCSTRVNVGGPWLTDLTDAHHLSIL